MLKQLIVCIWMILVSFNANSQHLNESINLLPPSAQLICVKELQQLVSEKNWERLQEKIEDCSQSQVIAKESLDGCLLTAVLFHLTGQKRWWLRASSFCSLRTANLGNNIGNCSDLASGILWNVGRIYLGYSGAGLSAESVKQHCPQLAGLTTEVMSYRKLSISIVPVSKDSRNARELLQSSLLIDPHLKAVEFINEEQLRRSVLDSRIVYPQLSKSAAFICSETSCSLPLYTVKELRNELVKMSASTVVYEGN